MKTEKIKSVPLRTCIVCKKMQPKKELLRVIHTKEGETFIDFTGRANGRGAYICDSPECILTCIKKRMLNRAFKTDISTDIYEQIQAEYEKKRV